MLVLRILTGLAIAPSLLLAAIDSAAPLPALAAWTRSPPRAEVAVSFDDAGRIATAAMVRSSGSRAGDAAAREAVLQLASLEPAGSAAGHTRVFSVALEAQP